MTALQTLILQTLLQGGSIRKAGGKYRLVDAAINPIRSFHSATFKLIEIYLKKGKSSYSIKRSEVRKLHGKNAIKKIYKEQLKKTNPANKTVLTHHSSLFKKQ